MGKVISKLSDFFEYEEVMYLYHGTSFHHFPSLFYGIDCTNSSNKKDFGKGFYLTPSFPLAVKNAKKAVKFNPDYPVVVSYKLNPEFMEKHFSILIFDQADEDWLGFIISNKSPHATQRIKNGFPNHFTGNYDIIYGPLADGLPNYKKVIRAFGIKRDSHHAATTGLSGRHSVWLSIP